MSAVVSTQLVYVIFDAADRIILICAGADAGEVADEWRERGHRVAAVDPAGVRAA